MKNIKDQMKTLSIILSALFNGDFEAVMIRIFILSCLSSYEQMTDKETVQSLFDEYNTLGDKVKELINAQLVERDKKKTN